MQTLKKKQKETLISQGKLHKFMQRKDPYRRQRRDGKNRKQETDNTKAPIGEIKMIAGELVAYGRTLRSYARPWGIKYSKKYY